MNQQEPKIPVLLTAQQMEAIRAMCDRTLKSPDGGLAVMGMVASILLSQEQAAEQVRATNQAEFEAFMRSKEKPAAPEQPPMPPMPPAPADPNAPKLTAVAKAVGDALKG